jgi:tetratricopeptide (TPR) repeat protein
MPQPDNQLELLPVEEPFTGETPSDLVFDDDPLDHLLYGAPQVEPTPVNALEIWKRNLDRSSTCSRAIATTVAKNHEDMSAADLEVAEQCLLSTIGSIPPVEELQLAHCYTGLARLMKIKNKTNEVEYCYREALKIFEARLGLSDEKTYETGMELVRLLEETGCKERATSLSIRLELGMLDGKEDGFSLHRLRQLALEMFLAGQYVQAEAAYRRLIEKQFELASSYCHLARVYLMTDRESEARIVVEEASNLLKESPAYVQGRIYFLKTLLQMLAGEEWQSGLKEIKTVLADCNAYMDWTIQPVLDHLQPRLEPDLYGLMTKIVSAICDHAKLPELESLEIWKNLFGESTACLPTDARPEAFVPF